MFVMVNVLDLKQFVVDIQNERDAGRQQQDEEKEETYLNAKQVCKKLDIAYLTLLNMGKRGTLKGTKVANRLRFKLSDVNKVLEGKKTW